MNKANVRHVTHKYARYKIHHYYCECGNMVESHMDDEKIYLANFCSHCGRELDKENIEQGKVVEMMNERKRDQK